MATTRYAKSGDVNIAYQVTGGGDHDLIYVPGWVSNVELMWDDPVLASILRRLGSFARLIIFDKRGTGMSDRVPDTELPSLEDRMDDVRAVMDEVGSERAILMGHSEGGNMATLFAATYPERTEGLILIGTYAKRVWSEDYPWAPKPADREAEIEETERTWGDPQALPQYMLGDRKDDQAFRGWMTRYFRMGASPRAAAQLLRMNTAVDTRAALPLVQVPTLCIYRTDDEDVKVEEGRWIASQIPNARFVELPGATHLFWASHHPDDLVDEIEEFVTGERSVGKSESILATVLFTDIVDSTKRASELGDQRWKALLESHNQVTRSELVRWRGVERVTTGDGFMATFDGPARAVRAALSITQAMVPLGIEVRAGLHTGEVQLIGDDVAGMGVHIGARIASMAGPGEVYVSRTVKDLVVGSQLMFEPVGSHQLKGVPGEWEVYAARG
ncbi:MAG: adenylate/guanylate cyclase domain-containing protein [Acidimicrobiia bacterium]|nr:adenylate/guanylate cyclase domain-containing protein [Acidimicrobiia bacterium]